MKKRIALVFAGVVSACATISTVEQPVRLNIEKIPDLDYEQRAIPAPLFKPPPKPQRTYHVKRLPEPHNENEDCSSIRTGNVKGDMNSKLDCLIRAITKDQQKGS